MKAARMLKTQAGFSLIELMIVVAIIGILASIAVPNFKKFQAKARQSEVKGQLTSLYTAEKAFYGEWTMYTGDFRDIGYAPEGKMRYQVGFPAVGTVPGAPFQSSTNGGVAVGTLFNTAAALGKTAAGFNFTQDANIPAFAAAAAGTVTGCTVAGAAPTNPAGGATFTASGITSKLALGSDNPDQWVMSDAKNLCNTVQGI